MVEVTIKYFNHYRTEVLNYVKRYTLYILWQVSQLVQITGIAFLASLNFASIYIKIDNISMRTFTRTYVCFINTFILTLIDVRNLVETKSELILK